MIITALIGFIIYINDKLKFNLVLAFVLVHYEQEKKKTQSRKDIFLYNAAEILFIMNEVLMGRPSHGLESWQELPINLRLNLWRKALCNWSLDVWRSYSLRLHDRWHIRTWNTFRSFRHINTDLNYYKDNMLDSAPKRINHTPFLKNTCHFTERHCFNANRQIWGNNNYIMRKGFWTGDQVYKDPVIRETNGFLRHVKHSCHSYGRHNYISSNPSNDFARNEAALMRIKSIQAKRRLLRESLSIQEINELVINYEKQKSLNYTNRPFSYWQDYIFDSYEANFYRIEREHASLLVDRIDLHFDLNTSHYYVRQLIINDIRDAEINLVKELLRKPFFP